MYMNNICIFNEHNDDNDEIYEVGGISVSKYLNGSYTELQRFNDLVIPFGIQTFKVPNAIETGFIYETDDNYNFMNENDFSRIFYIVADNLERQKKPDYRKTRRIKKKI